ncbi:MAG: rhodanese-like domain-containing protein [Fimbriimonadaceae bacterium]|nr:rhodanese-like domain-containing protein [Fimbriimonadaceae bacterium]
MRLAEGLAIAIDVRGLGEFNAGHVPGAIHVPLETLEARFDDLPRSSSLLLVCERGSRACIAAERLRETHPELTILRGGTAAWREQGLPIVRSVASAWSLERQVRLVAGVLALTGSVLALTVDLRCAYLSGFIGAGLTFAGVTNWCGMALLLARLPWNRAETRSGKAVRA